MQYYTLKVINLHFETDDTLTVSFKQPGLKRIKYLPGQYLTLIFNINNRKYFRPYSFSSAPEIDQTLDITVKRTPGGLVSNHIIDKIKVGDLIEVMEPMGDFTLENKELTDRHIILWGAGSGITPLISIAKYALHHKVGAHITLVYGNRNFENVIFNERIKNLKNQYPDSFSIWHFHTRLTVTANNPYVVQGRIDPHKVLTVMKSGGDLHNSFHYICGPEGLKESVNTTLINLGVDENNIFYEDFAIIRDPKEFENITTRNVSVKKNGQVFNIEVVRGKSILEAGLDSLIDLPYSCQTGNCITCKGRLLKGEIRMIGVKKIPAELKADECLLCCSFPLNDEVEIDVL